MPKKRLVTLIAALLAAPYLPASAAGFTATVEAENATLAGGAVVQSDHAGYSGSGFVGGFTDGNKGAAAVTAAVSVPTAATYDLSLRYANGTGSAKTLSLYRAGTKVQQFTLPASANWDSWSDVHTALSLPAGSNQLSYRFDSADSGNVNLDKLVVTSAAAPAEGTLEAESAALSGGAVVATDHPGYSGSGFVGGYTDANKGNAATTFSVSSTKAGNSTATLRYANGTGTAMTLSLYANGSKVRQISLPATSNWDTWGTAAEAVPVVAGANTIAYRFDSTDSGNVNLDNLTVAAPTDPPPTGGAALEGSFLSGGTTVGTSIAGYAGTGYVTGFTATGSRAIRTVNVTAAGNAATTLRYSNSTGSTKTLSVYTNGVKTGQLSLPAATGWATVTQPLPLRAGLNLIGYQFDSGDSGNVALDDLAVPGSTELATRGATVPYTEYEAENGSTNGVVIGPDRTYRTVASESSGRRAVRLDNAGKYTQFTLTKPANSIVVRYSIPDNAAGTGITAPLGVYVGGSKVKDLTLTSAYSWVYGNYPFPNDPALGGGHRFFDEVRSTLPSYPAGTVIKLQNDSSTPITVDLIDTEVVAAAYTIPANSVDVTAYGAVSGSGDDTAAFNSAISAAKSAGKTLWIPSGVFDLTARVNVDNVTIRGAGTWYSTIRGNAGRGGFFATGGNVQLADFYFAGDVRYRDPDGSVTTDAALEGNFGTGSLIHNVWLEHSKVGLWANSGTNGLYVVGVRIRDMFADGVNLNTFSGDGSPVSNSRVDQSTLRNTGDDALAMWSFNSSVANCAFTFNTASLPMLANTAAIYGGNGNRIEDNLFSDTVYTASGITLSTWHSAQPFSGTTSVQRNTISRAGGFNTDWNSSQGGLWIYAEAREITAPVLVKDVDIIDSTYQGILMSWQKNVTNLTFDHVKVQNTGTYGIDLQVTGSATFNNVTVSGAGTGGLNNAFGFTLIRGPGNSGF
jgi:alpha-1,3-glucanase-like protein/carbohydrate binding protein with CBM35 domain/carbohydrate binding protein with CBM6 domain/parallel beta helix pectate lyase-like protein